MNISLLISGNLTGFGRFYTSPAAKELLGADKIDLDNHNHISFLGDNEKAYSITFAQRFIAISLYTRILDSFRRPGELVVTLLIPRNQIIVPNSGSPIGAVYSLLNKVCDKFFEKNFQDGMINQNPVVLGQDYYSEILDNYRLKPMNMREVNSNPSSVKKVGYVKAQETDIPKYLDTPCRENYNNHNLIIIAQSAPAGIDEEPEEVILYSIHIKNNGATLPGRVKLTSPIYKYQAQTGEKPFPIQGSYKDAVEHLLEPRITARILPNDVVEISYNFEKEEKTVNFIFLDKNTGTPVSIDVVQPSVMIDGNKLPISSETFTFRGAEIYASKKLVSDNSNYTISKRSEILDLSRIGNNQNLKVYVEQGFKLTETFPKPHDYKKRFVFINKSDGQREPFDVTDRADIHLSGTISDWDFMMDSENFSVPQQAVRMVNGHWYFQVNGKPKVKTTTRVTNTNAGQTVAVQKEGGNGGGAGISLSGGNDIPSTPTKSSKRKNYKKIALLVLPILLVSGVALWYFWDPIFGGKNDNETGDTGYTEELSDGAYICYYDDSEEGTRDTLLLNEKDFLKYSFFNSNGKEITSEIIKSETAFDAKKFLVHTIELNDNNENIVKVKVSFNYMGEDYVINEQEINISKIKKDSVPSIEEIQGMNYGLRHSQLKEFINLENKTFNTKAELKDWKRQYLKGVPNEKLVASIEETLEHKEPVETPVTREVEPVEKPIVFPAELETATSSLTKKQLKDRYIDKNGISPEVKQRAQYMSNALAKIQKLERVEDASKLSSSQRITIKLYNKGLRDKDYRDILEKNINRLTSFGEVNKVVQNFVF